MEHLKQTYSPFKLTDPLSVRANRFAYYYDTHSEDKQSYFPLEQYTYIIRTNRLTYCEGMIFTYY